ncbi:MAG: DegQ family serine endoprotease, partial [Acidobacteria bacterium]|nr:DegQ family serine endoprotease [Acidobacteriota bacterium]
GALFGSAATSNGWFWGSGENKVPIYVSSDSKVNEQVTLNGGFSPIAKAVTPAVVTINVQSRARQPQMPFFIEPFRDFFENPGQPEQDEEGAPKRRTTPRGQPGPLRPSGVGSGIIVSPDGYILTNNHVVDQADKVTVELSDRRQFEAKVIGTDAPSDVAVIKIEAANLPTVPFGDSERVEIGDIVLAVGNPLGIGQTVTMGIISAKGRRSPSGDNRSYEDFLQTDAAINRGNSGGALVNLRGELIGIPSQILSQTGGSIGIGFAIPTRMARNVMDQLIRGGKVRRGKLGVYVRDIQPEVARQFGFKGTDGAFVDDVEKGEPADQAGVQPGDIITEFQGQRIRDSAQLRNMASQTVPGTQVKFKVWRDAAERELTAKLAEVDLAGAANQAKPDSAGESATGILSGIRVESLTPELAQRLNIPTSSRGVVVAEVDPESRSAAAGLRRGDVIERVGQQTVTSIAEFNVAAGQIKGPEVLVRVRRGDRGFFVVIQAQE